MPRSAITYRDTVLGDHLDALGIGSPKLVDRTLPVADALRRMHEDGSDCLLVTDEGQLVGIFTDRDAVVKAADKRLQLYRVEDFMTPDPVVLRHDDPIAVAIHKMAVGGFRHIPIVEDGKPTGVVAAARRLPPPRRRARVTAGPDAAPRVAILADDLIWATRLSDTVRRTGGVPVPVRSSAGLAAALEGASAASLT